MSEAVVSYENRSYVRLRIDDLELPLSPGTLLSVALMEGGSIPSLRIEISDTTGAINTSISQGNKITITILKSTKNIDKSYDFRVWTSKQRREAVGPIVTLDCLLDAPKYTTEVAYKGYKDTTSGVIENICKELDFEFFGIPTDDKQIWMRTGETNSNFIKKIMKNAYIDEKSCVFGGLTVDKKYKYFNPVKVLEQDPTHHFVMSGTVEQLKGKGIIVDQTNLQSNAGIFNQWANYGYKHFYYSIEGKKEKIDKQNMDFIGNFLPINEEIWGEVEYSNIDHGIPDCGNTHDNYNLAAYLNVRGLSLFTERLSVVTTVETECELFDPVWYTNILGTLEPCPFKDGIYIVIAKTIYLKDATNYYEKLLLARPYFNKEGTARLLS